MSGNSPKRRLKQKRTSKTDRLESIKQRRRQVTPNDVVWMIVEIEHLREKLDG